MTSKTSAKRRKQKRAIRVSKHYRYRKLSAQRLEPRLLLAADSLDAEGEGPDLVEYSLVITDTNGSPVNQVQVGQDFELRAFAEDLRGGLQQPHGVFAGYLDVEFNNAEKVAPIFGEMQRVALHDRFHGTCDIGDCSTEGANIVQPSFTSNSTFTLSVDANLNGTIDVGETTNPITPTFFNATTQVVQQEIEDLTGVSPGDITVVQNPLDEPGVRDDINYRWDFSFLGRFRRQDVPSIVLDTTNLATTDGQPFNASVIEAFPPDFTNPDTFRSAFTPGELYGNGRVGFNESTPSTGIYSEVGSFSTRFSISDPGEAHLLWKIGFTAEEPGAVTFTSNPADNVLQTDEADQSVTTDNSVQVASSWQNPENRLDVDDDGGITPTDVLLIVNDLNSNGARALPDPPQPPDVPPPFLDVNGDGSVSPADVLTVTRFLNKESGLSGGPSGAQDTLLFATQPPQVPTDQIIYGQTTITIVAPATSIDVLIDVKPGSDPNSINLSSKGVLPIGVYSTQTANGEAEDFDATTIDTSTVKLNGVAIDPVHAAFEDLDRDSDFDLILHFRVPELVDEGILDEESVDLALTAEYGDGDGLGGDLGGSDSIRIVPPKGKGKRGS